MAEPEAPTILACTAQQDPRTPPQQGSPAVHLLAERAAARPSHEGNPLNDDRQDTTTKSKAWDFYNSAQWTADGTTILVGSSEHTVSAFVLPTDLLESVETRTLEPQATTKLPEPTQTIAGAPYFSLAEPTTQSFLAGCRDHPIQLYHIFPNDDHAVPLCSYRLIRKETEAYITPSSLLWQYPGTHFICGSTNRLDYFDMSRPGSEGPLLTIPTIPSKRHIAKGSGVGMKGTVSALAASPPDTNGGNIIAAGTWTRWVGLYDLHHTDKAVAQWSVSNKGGMNEAADIGGQGIVQVLWSPCGRYLVVNERQSEGLLVYDIRGTGQLLSVLKGRKAATQQKLNCDVFQGSVYGGSSFEVWAGSQDGTVTVWEDVGVHEGAADPTWDWKAHESPIGSTIIHASGSVAATCSGGWGPPSIQDIDEEFGDSGKLTSSQTVFQESSLKVWSITAPQGSDEAQERSTPG
ncbi:Fc.00g092000.m01.CDS01 [Cosmosporella sp. VM-42]